MPEYEGLVIRPPSEAGSLILRYTIGCSHNRCIFCPAYKEKRFRVRSLAEMEEDIRLVERRFGESLLMPILGRIADPQAVPALAKYAMDDANRGELEDFVVVEALANIGLPSCIEALLKVSTQAPAGSKLAQIIAEGLGKAGWKPEKDVG